MSEKLLDIHGPLMHGKALYKALGFNSYRVFYSHFTKGNVVVNVFQITGRSGWFAKTQDVADWINKHGKR